MATENIINQAEDSEHSRKVEGADNSKDIEDTNLDKPETEIIYDPMAVDWDKFSENKELWAIFFEQFQSLPEILKNILLDLKTQIILRNIQAQFQLQGNQVINLSRLIRQIVITQIYLGNFVQEIKNKLEVDSVESREIANYILLNLFSKEAIEELKKLHIAKFGPASPGLGGQIKSDSAQVKPPEKESGERQNIVNLRNSE